MTSDICYIYSLPMINHAFEEEDILDITHAWDYYEHCRNHICHICKCAHITFEFYCYNQYTGSTSTRQHFRTKDELPWNSFVRFEILVLGQCEGEDQKQ